MESERDVSVVLVGVRNLKGEKRDRVVVWCGLGFRGVGPGDDDGGVSVGEKGGFGGRGTMRETIVGERRHVDCGRGHPLPHSRSTGGEDPLPGGKRGGENRVALRDDGPAAIKGRRETVEGEGDSDPSELISTRREEHRVHHALGVLEREVKRHPRPSTLGRLWAREERDNGVPDVERLALAERERERGHKDIGHHVLLVQQVVDTIPILPWASLPTTNPAVPLEQNPLLERRGSSHKRRVDKPLRPRGGKPSHGLVWLERCHKRRRVVDTSRGGGEGKPVGVGGGGVGGGGEDYVDLQRSRRKSRGLVG